MPLAIETSRRIHGPAARLALIEAIRDAGASQPETDWIEWKSEADLTAKTWQGELATHILGFANRDPASAARNTQGFAYLIVGAQAGHPVAGIEPLDSAKLDDGIARYVGGANGPVWEPDYVLVDDKQVLVITIEPPSPGDPIWTLRKAFTDPADKTHHEGRIFVRRMGQTVPQPSTAEIEMLQRRSQRPRVGLDLDLAPVGEVLISSVDLSEIAKGQWRKRERKRFTAELPKQEPGVPAPFAFIGKDFTETRTPQQFGAEIDEYLDKLTPFFPDVARIDALNANLGRLQLKVVNNSDDNFHQVLIELYIEGDVLAAFSRDEVEAGVDWPSRPRRYGTSMFEGLTSLARPEINIPPLRSGDIDNSASARIRFPVFDLRPGYERELSAVHLFVGQELAGTELSARWVATATSVSGSAAGNLAVQIAPDPVHIDDL